MKRTKKCYKNGSAAILTSIVLTVAKASEVFRLLITDNCFPEINITGMLYSMADNK
jgi:hypothetical protein